MRIVLDTNVLVSALLSPEGSPGKLLRRVLAGDVNVLLDQRILAEYRAVLARPKFPFAPEDIEIALGNLARAAEWIAAVAFTDPIPDLGDLPFIEVARSGAADAIVTGNLRHYPAEIGVPVLLPADCLGRLG